MLKKLILAAFLAAASACGLGTDANDNGPVIAKADIPISDSDIDPILVESRAFADRNGLDFEGDRGNHGFTLSLKRGDLLIAAYNTVNPTITLVRAWDKGAKDPQNVLLSGRYIATLKSSLQAKPTRN